MKTSLSIISLLALGMKNQVAFAVTSQQCMDDTNALQAIVEIQEAFETSSSGAQVRGTNCNPNSDSLSCTFDFSNISSEFATACTAHGGQVFTTDIRMMCTTTAGTSNLVYRDFPECIGATCDPDKYEEQASKLFEVIGGLVAGDDAAQCEFQVGDEVTEEGNSSANSGSNEIRPVAAMIAGMSALMMVLL